MSWKQVRNWARTSVSGSIAAGATVVTVEDASVLPVAEFWAVVWNAGEGTPDADPDREIVLVTAVDGNTLTVTRGQQGTAALAHPAGCSLANVITAGDKEELTAAVDGKAAAGHGHGLDDLTDVATTGAAEGNPLVYDSTAEAWGPGGDLAVTGRLDATLTYTTDGSTGNDRLTELVATVSSDNATAARYPRALFAQIDVAGSTSFAGASEVIGLQGQARHFTGGVTVNKLIGLHGRAGGWNTAATNEAIGLQGIVQSGIFGGGSSSSANATFTTAAAVDATLTIFNNGTMTATNAYLFRGAANKPGTGVSAIANFYGLYLPAITFGTTLNRAIHCAGGDSVHAGNFRFGGTTAPAYAVDVTGAVACSGAFGCNGCTPQARYASGGAVSTSAGSYGFGSDAERADLTALVGAIRAALVANGIIS